MSWKNSGNRVLKVVFASLLLFSMGASNVVAETRYPTKPITIYYGYKAGGTCHVSLQPLAQALEKALGQPVVLVEKPGASATIAGGTVSKAKPDGYTLGVIKSTTITTAPYELKLPYSPATDLMHLYAYAGPASGFAVRADAPWKTWREFLDYAKANPGKVAWTATGSTGTEFLLMEYIAKQEGVQWNGVPSAGGAESMKLVLGGQVAGYASSGSHIPHVKSGNARLLVAFGSNSPIPGVPTLEELGYQGLTIEAEPYIIVAPKGVPGDIQAKLVSALDKATAAPEYLTTVERIDMQPVNLKGADLQKRISDGSALVAKLLKAAGKIQ